MRALAVAGRETEALTALILEAGMSVTPSETATEAAHLISEKDFDSIIILSPVRGGSAAELAGYAADTTLSAVILLAPADTVEPKVKRALREKGVFVLETPLKQEVLSSVLQSAAAGAGRFRREKEKLDSKLKEMRALSRAKGLLMSQLNMSEDEAHKFIEREAMNRRMTKAEIAARILRTYQN